jgi:RNA polymerase sigma-70 factor (ECF subfamily)
MTFAYSILAAGRADVGGGRHAKLSTLVSVPDTELLACLRSADESTAESAFDTIYRTYYARLVALARPYTGRATAEELVQDVFASVWIRRTVVAPNGMLGVYLYASVRNAAISLNRHDRIVGRVEHSVLAEGDTLAMGAPEQRADSNVEYVELFAAMSRVLGSLSDGMRTAFTLRWIHELSYAEVAEIMGIAEPAARKQVSRAREAILPLLRRFVND